MKIKIEYITDNSEGSEIFDSIEDAENYLEELRENTIIDDKLDEDYDIRETDVEKDKRFQGYPNRISLPKSDTESFQISLEEYLKHGYEITYTGKTGYTLEKIISK